MGMIGCYAQIDNERLKNVRTGEKPVTYDELSTFDKEDIDKSWHGIANTLAADAEKAASYVVPTMEDCVLPFDEGEFPFGIFGVDAEQVKQVSVYLENVDLAELYDFDSLVQMGTYPLVDNDSADEFLEYISFNFMNLKNFYKSAAEKGKAIVFYII